jgi:hypothetical protein
MKNIHILCLLLIAGLIAYVWQTRSRRSPPNAGTAPAQSTHFQPGVFPRGTDDYGYLALKIVAVHRNQRPLDQIPWHEAGGDWTFVECVTKSAPPAAFLVGVLGGKSTGDEAPMSWGKARMAVNDSAQGAKVIETLAQAFHATPPAARSGQPPCHIEMTTAVLGEDLRRDPAGGFKGKSGGWTATKWFIEDEDTGEAEVYFNFSLSSGEAELCEKDDGYREPLLATVAARLRDGPMPERTTENDPTLTLDGPTISDWQRFADSRASAAFGADGTLVLLAEPAGKNAGSRLSVVPVDQPAQARVVAEFEGVLFDPVPIPTDPSHILCVETLPTRPGQISSQDPLRLWLITLANGERRDLGGNLEKTRWSLATPPVSPDGQFVVLQVWHDGPGGKLPRRAASSFVPLTGGAAREAALPAQSLSFVRWEKSVRGAIAVLREGLSFEKGKNALRWFVPHEGKFVEHSDAAKAAPPPDALVAPDDRQAVVIAGSESKGEERLVFTDLANGSQREFHFNERDRPYVFEDCVVWANERYLVFHGARAALVDSRNLKLSFSIDPTKRFQRFNFSPDFRHAIASGEEGWYIGRVSSP